VEPTQHETHRKQLARFGIAAPSSPAAARWKSGWRIIGGTRKFYRSRWEANYARFLEFQRLQGWIAKWEHEAKTFWFDGIRRGCVAYLPDFKVTLPDGGVEYHEVKGWMDGKSRTKLKRMAKFHPAVRVRVFDAAWYRKHAGKLSKLVEGWE